MGGPVTTDTTVPAAVPLLHRLLAAGFEFDVADDRLRVRPADRITPAAQGGQTIPGSALAAAGHARHGRAGAYPVCCARGRGRTWALLQLRCHARPPARVRAMYALRPGG